MTRDELLDLLRRELSTGEWSDLRPGERLADIDEKLDRLRERTADVRSEFDEVQEEDILRALDDLAAAASYLRQRVGAIFSDVTRLADELRAARKRARGEAGPEQIGLNVDDGSEGQAADEEEDGEGGETGRQQDLFE